MSRSLLLLSVLVLCVLAPAVQAQEARPREGGEGDLFTKLDADNDGVLASDELPEAQRRLFDRLLRTSDKNEDGKLDRAEFEAGLKADRPPGAPPPEAGFGGGDRPEPGALFQRLDANGDGKIVRDEIPEGRGEFLLRMMERADRDGDSALSREEFGAAMAFMANMQRGGPPRDGEGAERRGPPEGGPRPGGDLLFRTLDADGDGKLNRDEVYGASDALKRLDHNTDGLIDRAEAGAPGPMDGGGDLARGGERRPGGPPNAGAAAEGLIRQQDKDGDGQLTREEAPERMAAYFDRIDTNGDGFIDAAEARQAIETMMRQREGPGGGQRQRERDGQRDKPAGDTAERKP